MSQWDQLEIAICFGPRLFHLGRFDLAKTIFSSQWFHLVFMELVGLGKHTHNGMEF